MRKYCLDCVIKHLGQAMVTQMESNMGYPNHILLTIGHLSEASEECFDISKELAEEIRQHRLQIMANSNYEVPYFHLYEKVKKLIEEKGCGNCVKAKNTFKDKIEKKKEQLNEQKQEPKEYQKDNENDQNIYNSNSIITITENSK